MTKLPSYVYEAVVVRVIDADTVVVDVDLGFYVTVRQSARLLGINAWEISTPAGKAARLALGLLLVPGQRVTVDSVTPDKYAGRFDGHIFTTDGLDVASWLVAHNYAVGWDGRGERPLPPWPRPGE